MFWGAIFPGEGTICKGTFNFLAITEGKNSSRKQKRDIKEEILYLKCSYSLHQNKQVYMQKSPSKPRN